MMFNRHSNTLNLLGQISTNDFHGYSLKFSPTDRNIIAVAASQNYGIKGSGAVLLIDLGKPRSQPNILQFDEGLYDLDWNVNNHNVLLSCSAEGSIQIWNTVSSQTPLQVIKAHQKEISTINWSYFTPQHFCTASWDGLLKIWDAQLKSVISELVFHQSIIYEACWSKIKTGALASVSGDGTLAIWEPSRSPHPVQCIKGLPGTELLTCGWSHCSEHILASASTDSSIDIWDLRFHNQPFCKLIDHNFPVRRLSFSPIMANELLSASYDFTTKLWDFSNGNVKFSTVENHSEFVYDVTYDPIELGRVADVSWDRKLNIYKIGPDLNMTSFKPMPSSTLFNSMPTTSHLFHRPSPNSRPLPPLPQGVLACKL